MGDFRAVFQNSLRTVSFNWVAGDAECVQIFFLGLVERDLASQLAAFILISC